MNYLTAGESHGKFIMGILNGMPSGLCIDEKYISMALKKRREVCGRGERQKIEGDEFEIISGILNGKTTGMPVGIIIKNLKTNRYPNKAIPCHGEKYAALKYSHSDYSISRERLSQRETAVRVALFCFPRKMIEELGVSISSKVLSCYGEKNSKKFNRIIEKFKAQGESFGGRFEIRVKNIAPGIGGFSQGEERLQSKLSKILFSMGSIKSVEFGEGTDIEKYKSSDIFKKPQLLGGIEGGVTDGCDIIIRCSTRPLSAVKKIDPESSSDTTSVFAAAYIAEFLVSYIIADEILHQFGSDIFENIKKSYLKFKIR